MCCDRPSKDSATSNAERRTNCGRDVGYADRTRCFHRGRFGDYVKARIEHGLREHEGRFSVIQIPNITNIFYVAAEGRMGIRARILSKTRSNYFLLVTGVIYLAFSVPFLNRPGLEYDEVLFGSGALGLKGGFIEYRWSIAGHQVPLMLMPYIGAIKAYIYKSLFLLFSPSALTVRLPVILIGLMVLILTYHLTRNLFGKLTALLAAALVATDPSYIFHIRNDWGPVALMLLFKVGSLYFLARFAQTRQRVFLIAAAFFLGLGLYDKANFLWYLLALPLAAFLVWPAQCRALISRRSLATVGTFFILGCWPFLLYNVVKKGASFRDQAPPTGNLRSVVEYKTHLLIETLNGNAAYHFFNDGDAIGSFRGAAGLKGNPLCNFALRGLDFQATLLPPALLSAAFLIGLILLFGRNPGGRVIAFFVLISLLILVEIVATPRATGPHHIMMLYPFPQIIVAYAASELLSLTWGLGNKASPLNIAARVVAAALLLSLLVSNVVVDLKYLQSFRASGGKGIWSDAIYELADYAKQNSGTKLVLMDWGFENQLQLLSRGSINREEFFWSLLDQKREEELADTLYQKFTRENNDIFVFHAPQCTQFSEPRRIFDRMLEKHGLRPRPTEVLYQRDGPPVYLLERVAANPEDDRPWTIDDKRTKSP